MLHLGSTLLKSGHSALDQQLASLERDLASCASLEIRKLLQVRAEVLGDIANVGLVGPVVGKDLDDEVVLRADSGVGEDDLNNVDELLLVGVTQRKDDLLVAALAGREDALNIVVLVEELGHGDKLVCLEAVLVAGHDVKQGCKGATQKVSIAGRDSLVGEALESLLEGLGRELGAAGVRTLDNLLESAVELGRHAGVESRSLGAPLAIRQLGVTEDSDEVLERALHHHLVVVTLEDVLENAHGVGEPLWWLGSKNAGCTNIGDWLEEGLSRLDLGRVIERQDTENVTSLESGAGLLDKVDKTVLLSDQRHVHLHDLNLGKGLALLDVLTVLNSVLDELTRGRGAQLSWVVLLLEQAGLAIDRHADGTHLLPPVDAVRATTKKDKETPIRESTNANKGLAAVEEQGVAVGAGASDGELVLAAVVDELDREDSLENVLARDLTLLETSAVLVRADIAGNV